MDLKTYIQQKKYDIPFNKTVFNDIKNVEKGFFHWFEMNVKFFDNQIDKSFFKKNDIQRQFILGQCVNNSLYMHLNHNLPYYEGLAYDKKRGEGYFHAFNIHHNNIEVIDSTFSSTKDFDDVKKEGWDKLTDWCGVEIPKWFIKEEINKKNSIEIHSPFIYQYYYMYVAKH